MIDPQDDQVKLIDFGHARMILTGWNDKLSNDEYCGSRGFRAPEIKESGILSTKADIFSSGVVFLHLLVPHLFLENPALGLCALF